MSKVAGSTRRVMRKEYQKLLLDGPHYWWGTRVGWRGKHVGAGVYEVWREVI